MVTRRKRSQDDRNQNEEPVRTALSERAREVEELRSRISEMEVAGGHFLAEASHAVKNPLTVIQSYLEILHSDLSDGLTDQQLTFLGIIYDNVMRLRDLIEDVSDIAALETRTAQLDLAPVDAPAIVKGACEEIRPAAQRGQLMLEIEIEKSDAKILVDSTRLEEVLQRMLENAVRFTERGGTVTVRAYPHANQFVIEIADTGAGISGDQLEEIFRPFVQLHRKPGAQREGYGLGLPISRRLIEAFGGTLTVESELDVGSTFSVHLPAHAQAG